jgi:hypothetical protein
MTLSRTQRFLNHFLEACVRRATLGMVQTVAHLVEYVFPQVPVSPWVVSFPQRLHYCLHRDMTRTERALRGWLRVVEARLRACCPGAPAEARFRAVSFMQSFGASINAHTPNHCAIIESVFSERDGALCFHPASVLGDADVAAVERVVARDQGGPL